MEFKIGKTLYKSNLYLKDYDSNLINKSNIEFLTNKYSYKELNDLSDFSKIDDLFILDKNLTSKFKRPKVIMFNKSLFLRDDIFFKLNEDMNKDPVIDYNTLIKIEDKVENKCLNDLFLKLKNVDFNKFINCYRNEKEKGLIEIDLNIGNISFEYKEDRKYINRNLLKND